MKQRAQIYCPICQAARASDEMKAGFMLPGSLVQIIQREHPTWSTDQAICVACVQQAKAAHMQQLLQSKSGVLSPLEATVLESIRTNALVTVNTEEVFQQKRTALDVCAEAVAAIVSSWYFAGGIFVFLLTWIAVNVQWRPFEPYPAIVLAVIGAVFASLSALQGPIILMVQKRQRQRDRLQADHDYLTNLKAELEIRYLHEKMDEMLTRQGSIMTRWQGDKVTGRVLEG
ncbi:MAG: DUF1003 domain-containing protein [Caldilinea sp. CFX5]|nr:DUF1003 domain-containing protein [Caldilinea sp. CFX5]